MGRLCIVGLGPAGTDLLTVAAAAAIADAGKLLLRTARHPAAVELSAAGVDFGDCDDIYDAAESLEAAYASISERVLEQASRGDVVYAVPGAPSMGEATVRHLRAACAAAGVEVDLVEGLSFVEPVLAAVGVDPLLGGMLLVDGRRLEEQLDGRLVAGAVPPALLVAQVDRAGVLSDAKLALLDWYPPEHEVSLVVGAATDDCEVHTCPLAELDWAQVDPGPLASLYVPAAPLPDRPLRPFGVTPAHREAGRAFADLVALQDRLRSPGGCPWDADQTHASLARHLLEEAYEVVDVLDRLPPEAPDAEVDPALYALLEEELGDFVMQAVFHARLAEEAAAFDAASVVDGIVDKLVLRHPHVFGDLSADNPAEVIRHWEDVKAVEKARASALDDIPTALPSLTRAMKVLRRSERSGLDWDTTAANLSEAAGSLDSRMADDAGTTSPEGVGPLVGRALVALCAVAARLGIDPEGALRAAVSGFEKEFRAIEGTDRGALDGASSLDLLLRSEEAVSDS